MAGASKNYHLGIRTVYRTKSVLSFSPIIIRNFIDYYNSQLLQAMSLYSNQARGNASQKYAELLVEECTNFWMAGRQACEELSLTGNHCINRKHQTSSQQQDSSDKLPTIPHKSSLTFISGQ